MRALTLKRKLFGRIVEYAINVICIFLLARMLTMLCFMDNSLYQTQKNVHASHAFLFLALFMFIKQRVRLVNWQSLIASLLYWPIAYFYRIRYIDSSDLFNRDKVVVWIVWIALLIIIDMAVYKKVNPLQKFHPIALSIYGAMTFFLIFYRNWRTYPIILILVFLFYLIPMEKKQWNSIVNQFCISWIIAFYYMLYRSLKYNPAVNANGRWYGEFVNIGDFGIFTACTVAVILFQIYQSKKRFGRKSIPYAIYCICILPVIWTVFRVSTITMFIGIGCIFLMGFVLLRKDTSLKAVLVRLAGVLLGISALVFVGLLLLKALANTDAEYWENILRNGNAFIKPFANIIHRAHYMFGETRTFSDSGVFHPDSLINYLDLFASGRLSICALFAEKFNYIGNASEGIQVGTYYAYNAHNTYVQMLYEYGYAGGGLYILWMLYLTGASMAQYRKEKKLVKVFPALWLAMALGVQLGEYSNLYSPLLVMTLVIIYPLMIRIDESIIKEDA